MEKRDVNQFCQPAAAAAAATDDDNDDDTHGSHFAADELH